MSRQTNCRKRKLLTRYFESETIDTSNQTKHTTQPKSIDICWRHFCSKRHMRCVWIVPLRPLATLNVFSQMVSCRTQATCPATSLPNIDPIRRCCAPQRHCEDRVGLGKPMCASIDAHCDPSNNQRSSTSPEGSVLYVYIRLHLLPCFEQTAFMVVDHEHNRPKGCERPAMRMYPRLSSV